MRVRKIVLLRQKFLQRRNGRRKILFLDVAPRFIEQVVQRIRDLLPRPF
jgi:hypothetical protein